MTIAQYEHLYGAKFPPAVREWYSLRDAREILEKYSNYDAPLSLNDLLESAKQPKTFRYWDFSGQTMLPFIVETQASCLWAIHLDGSDDPPVRVAGVSDGVWELAADKLSFFILNWVWNHFYWQEECVLYAEDQSLSLQDLAFLRQVFTELPTSNPAPAIFKFMMGDKHIHIWTINEQQSRWWLQAGSKTSLLELAQKVEQCGTLFHTLKEQPGSVSDCPEYVLGILRSTW